MVKELVTDVEQLSVRAKEFDVLANEQNKSIELVQDLCDTLETLPDRLYLTANQIGHEERAVAIKFKDEIEVFMNPAIQAKDKMIIMREKDLLTGKEYLIPRFAELTIAFQDCLGKTQAVKMNEAASTIMGAALDALNGILVSDYGLEVDDEFDKATEDEKAELIKAYVDSLTNGYKKLDEELSNDEETKATWTKAKFYKGIADGTIKTEPKAPSNREKKRLKKLTDSLKHQANKLKFWSTKKDGETK